MGSFLLAFLFGNLAFAANDRAGVEELLARDILRPRATLNEAVAFAKARLPALPVAKTAREWDQKADQIRQAVLAKAYFRGPAAEWRKAKTKPVLLETIAGGPGYRIKKLRYEVVPGLWIPALLYEPEKVSGKMPVHLAVNGHDAKGKSVDYKQLRCINLAKRGMIVLNLEWFGMGQLRSPGYHHGRLDQLNLCGASGLAPFLLAMMRGIDILLDHPNADPERLAVHGLSGGGWQTITISALDTRVKLCNPVAGYSSYRTRLEHFKDLGDSEQTPCDMATVADYSHYTAMLAPRPTLLTYNAKDQCCFESVYALEPLLAAARPAFALHHKDNFLRAHVNEDPGTHNFHKDNRQALYRMVGDFFFPGDHGYSAEEIASESELKSDDQLNVELPKSNATFQTLALDLAKTLPRHGELPNNSAAAKAWRIEMSMKLRNVVRFQDYSLAKAERIAASQKDGVHAEYWQYQSSGWTIPLVELSRGQSKGTVILVGDGGRKSLAAVAKKQLDAGHRVWLTDVFYFGESKMPERDYLIALMISTVGERPLGIQASQLALLCTTARAKYATEPVTLRSIGPRTSVAALVAAALGTNRHVAVELDNPLGSLKQVIEENRSVEQSPELFCFGLLETADIRQIVALIAPGKVTIHNPSSRVVRELEGIRAWYRLLGHDFDCLKPAK